MRADLKRTSHDGRIAKLRELDALRRQVSDAKSHYASSVQMLMREGLGGEKRSRLIQQLEHSGPTELASLAAFAVSAKDRELAAALVTRVNRIPFGERPFAPQELADAIVGDEYRAIHAAIGEVESLAERALIEDRAFETGKPSGERMISLALRQRDRAGMGDPDAIETLIAKED